MERLAIEVLRRHNGVMEVVVSGRLGLDGVAGLRRAVHKCAAEMPTGLVLDLNAVTEVDDLALLAIPALQSYCGTLAPPFALVVHAAPASLAARALQSHLGATVAVFADMHSASGYMIAAAEPWPTAQLFLRPRPTTPGQCRRFLERTCRNWLIPWVAHRAQLVAGELVANAIAYAPGPARLTVSLCQERLRISVRDGSSKLPTAPLGAPSPRWGLGVVELASIRWGTFLLRPGKAVWADISLLAE
jgi:anti-anti-sigma regulatory factor